MRMTTELCLWIRKTAFVCARRSGLTREESEDCAGDALMRLLDLDERGQLQGYHLSRAWLYRCIDNYAKNAARTIRRRAFHERARSDYETSSDGLCAYAAGVGVPEKAAIRRELLLAIRSAISKLSTADLILFHLRCLNGEPVAVVATAVHRTPGAVREAVRALRQRLRMLLAREGFTEVVIAEYLGQIGLAPPGMPVERRPVTE